METNFFNNIQRKVKKMKVERKIKQKGTKKVLYKCPQKISRYQNKKFFGNGLKDKYNTKNGLGEESNVWKYTYLLQVAS